MPLTPDIVSQFAKATVNKQKTKDESTAWGVVESISESGKCFVKLDGSNRVTPVILTTEVAVGDRVSITIKNHSATVMGNASSPSISANGSTMTAIRTDFKNLSADNADIRGKLTANEADISKLTATNALIEGTLTANEARIKNLETNTLTAEVADLKYATIENLNGMNGEFRNLLVGYAKVENLDTTNATIETLKAEDAAIRDLFAAYATLTHLESTYATIGSLNATTANVNALSADVAGIHSALIDYATVAELKAGYATIASLKAVDAKVGNLNADVGNINELIFGSASGDVIHTNFANAVIAQLGDAQIKSAMIQDISASKITAGDIITDNVKVKSEDGKLLIADQTIQISDTERVRVQIGKDASGDYSINIWDADGKLMFSEGGLTEDAVKEQIIRNDMVKDDANISASKLNIDTLFNVINEDGSHTLKSSKVKLDEQNQTLDVAFGALTTKVDGQSETISSQGTAISVIQGNISSKIWKQDITSAINDISIGGRNLLLNTGRNGSITLVGTSYPACQSTITNITNDGGELTLECSATDREIYYRFMNPDSENLYGLEPGKSYTLSGKAKVATISGTLVKLTARSQDYISGGWSGGVSTEILTSDSDEWVDFESTFTIRENATGVYISIQLYYTDSWIGTIYLKDLKFEQGNKATAWTAAPEDTEKDITNLSTQYSTLNQTIDGINATVAKHTTDVTTLSGQVSDLVIDLNGFRTTVSETYTTKEEFSTRMSSAETSILQTKDSITLLAKKEDITEALGDYYKSSEIDAQWAVATEQFGGAISSMSEELYTSYAKRNLLRNTGGGGDVVIAYGNTTAAASNITSRTNVDGVQTLVASATDQEIYYRFMQVVNTDMHGLEPGKTYTLSGKVKIATTSGSFGSLKVRSQHYASGSGWTNGYDGGFDISQSIANFDLSEWTEFTKTFTIPENAVGYYLSFQMYYDGDLIRQGSWSGIIEFKELKLELGSIRTPWSPAPEDTTTISSRLTVAESGIKVLQDSIDLYVTKDALQSTFDGYYTKTETDSRIKLNSDAIVMTVASHYIGGESIIDDTYLSERELGGYPTDGYTDGISGKTTVIPTGDEYILIFEAKSTVAGDIISCFFYSPNTTLTVVKSTDPTTTSSKADGQASITLTDKWAKYWVRYTQNGSETTTTKSWIVGRRSAGHGSGIISVRNIAMMAPSTINSVNSKIEQLADSIKLEVTSSAGKTAGITLTTGDKKTETELPVRKAFEDDPTAITISAGTVTFNSNTFVVDSTYFKVSSNGTINATGGTIGGMILHTYGIYSYSSSYPNGYGGLYSITGGGYNAPCFFAGAADEFGNNAKFYVTHAGKLYAGDAEINGDITTTSGKQKATLTSGELTFYYDDEKQGLISSKYHPNASYYGLTLRIPSMDENSLTGITFVHEVGSEGSGYVVDYAMHNMEVDGIIPQTDGSVAYSAARHKFYGGMYITGGLYVSGQIYTSGHIYLPNLCAIGWYDKNGGGPRQLLSFDNENVFTVGSNSYWMDAHKLTLPNGDSKGLFMKNSDSSTRLRILEMSGNALSIGYGLYAKNTSGYIVNMYATNKMVFQLRGEKINFDIASTTAQEQYGYSAYLMPGSTGKCCLGSANYKWYRLYSTVAESAASDRRMKKDIAALSDIHSELFDRLEPVQYKFIENDRHICYGLIAQDVISAMAELGIEEDALDLAQHEYNVDPETGELTDYYGLAYTNIIPMLIHEVQKLKHKIKTLEGE